MVKTKVKHMLVWTVSPLLSSIHLPLKLPNLCQSFQNNLLQLLCHQSHNFCGRFFEGIDLFACHDLKGLARGEETNADT